MKEEILEAIAFIIGVLYIFGISKLFFWLSDGDMWGLLGLIIFHIVIITAIRIMQNMNEISHNNT